MSINYYPILKWKKGEQGALKNLNISSKNFFPILEVVEECSADDFFLSLSNCYSSPVYFDVNRLDSDCLTDFIECSHKNNISAFPVLYIDTLFQNPSLELPQTFAVKIPTPVDFEGPSFEEIIDFLSQYNNHTINLILDGGEVLTSRDSNNIYEAYYRSISNNLEKLSKFENIIVCLTSFPIQLTIESGEDISFKRYDILIFKKLLDTFKTSSLAKKIHYSDYGVTKFTGSEWDFSKMRYGVLPKVKYTTNTHYIVKKGERNHRYQTYTRSYIDICKELVQSSYFFSAEFSYGDKCIYDKATSISATPGNSQQWVTYCANHHLAVLMEQLSSLGDF